LVLRLRATCFFKILDIFLFIVESAWFLMIPTWPELKGWGRMRRGQVPYSHLILLWLPRLVLIAMASALRRQEIEALLIEMVG